MPAFWGSVAAAGITGGANIGLGILGANQQADNAAAARKQAKEQNKYNKEVWRFNNAESDRTYDFKVEEQEILKRNTEADLQFQDDARLQSWDYNMGIRDYEFSQQMRAYDESVFRATNQKGLNQTAFELANENQNNFYADQLLNLVFEEDQTFLDYGTASSGLSLKEEQKQEETERKLFAEKAQETVKLGRSAGETEQQLQEAKTLAALNIGTESAKAGLKISGLTSLADLSISETDATTKLKLQKFESDANLAIQRGGAEAKLALTEARSEAKRLIERGDKEAALQLLENTTKTELAKVRKGEEARLAVTKGRVETGQAIRQARTQTIINQQKNTIQELKARGAALAASPAGRSSRKIIQGILAESGSAQAAETQQFMLAQSGALQQQALNEATINQQLSFDQQELSQNLLFANQAIKQKQILDEQAVSQKLLTEEIGIQQTEGFDKYKALQTLGFNSALEQTTANYSIERTAKQLALNVSTTKQDLMLSELGTRTKLGLREQNLLTEKGFNDQAIMLARQLNEAEIVQQLLFTEQGVDLDLDNLDKQLELDKNSMLASRKSLATSDATMRQRLEMQLKQADLIAENNIMVKPELRPALPKPATLPRPEFGEVFKPGTPPEPDKRVTPIGSNPYALIGQSALSALGNFAQSDAFGDIFGNMFGNNNTFGNTLGFNIGQAAAGGYNLPAFDSLIFNNGAEAIGTAAGAGSGAFNIGLIAGS